MEKQIIEIAVGKGLEEWQVPVYVLEAHSSSSRAPAIHFSCGFCMEPWMYEEYLEGVYEGLEGKVNIFASGIVGHKIESNVGRVFQNDNREACVRLFQNIIEELDYGNDVNIVHSAGPRTIPDTILRTADKYVLINPMIPVNYGAMGFILRDLAIYASEIFNEDRTSSDYEFLLKAEHKAASNFRDNLRRNLAFAQEFKSLAMDDLYPTTDADALMVYSGNQHSSDLLFKYTSEVIQNMKEAHRTLKHKKVKGSGHGEVLCNPYQFIRLTVDFLRS